MIRENKIDFFIKRKFFILFFIFWLFLLLCSALGNIDNYSVSFKSSFTYLRFGIFVVLFTYLSQNFIDFKEKLIISTIITILFAQFLVPTKVYQLDLNYSMK